MFHESTSGLLVPSRYATDEERTRGFGSQVTASDPYKQNIFSVISYDDVDGEQPILTEKNIRELQKLRKPSELIPILIKSIPLFWDAMNAYKQNINQGVEITSPDTRTKEAIQMVLASLEANGNPLDEIIEDQIYCMKAEGGVSFELNFENDELIDMAYVSPYTIKFEKIEDDPFKRYRLMQKGRLRTEDVTVYDPTDPQFSGENQFYFYRGVNKLEGRPRGLPIYTSAMRSAILSLDVDNLFVEHLRGQAFPRGFLSPQIEGLISAGITGDSLINNIKSSVDELKKKLDTAKPSESVISSIPFDFVVLGTLARSNLDGGEIVTDKLLYNMQVALDIPDNMLPSRKTGVLGEQSGRTQWRRWQTSLRNGRNALRSQIEPAMKVAVSKLGIPYGSIELEAVFDNTDHEGMRMESEALKIEADGLKILLETGVIAVIEAREVISQYDKFTNLEVGNIPPAPQRLPAPQEPIPEEPIPDEPTDTE